MRNLNSCGPFNEVRFYGESSNHGRILHFKSTNKTDHVDRTVNGGGGTWTTLLNPPGVPGVLAATTIPLTGHTANLPTTADNFNLATNGGDFDAVFPMAQVQWFQGGGDSYLVARSGNRWDMDESGTTFLHDSIHRMWLRM